MVQIHSETQRWPGPEVDINCPVCHARGVPATTCDQQTSERLYGLIPVNNVRSSWVVCSACGTALRSRVGVAELGGKSADEIAPLIHTDAGFIRKSMAVVALLLAIFPCVGTVVAVIVLIANLRLPGWPRTLSWVATGLSLLTLGLVALLFLFESLGLLK
jgi:hypothetical protein